MRADLGVAASATPLPTDNFSNAAMLFWFFVLFVIMCLAGNASRQLYAHKHGNGVDTIRGYTDSLHREITRTIIPALATTLDASAFEKL